ncbi:nucleotidyl transferase AbiEii/AbiGii toxin family protein [Streptomyces sp. RerS4]|uniref:nucleotidyl transferase AbiEii/AbiGii toxin family protein n=1 Tax=Streptomyces sp. RerS4 TaxID=2942449 RepID=UPI00201C5046|nr:nucleotidyl transferase AbiEii/AbiGii toxin family protein [Streptomyces sp. RerS4]UQX01066.1 nucleotidyl transferase AbiEii/AbiGii toxin family protein [Streptomyces sp. RerS4]
MNGNDGTGNPRSDWARRQEELPRTSTTGLAEPGREGDLFFDPALKHFAHGYRVADTAVDPGLRPAWQAARRRALDVMVRGVAESGWADSLVLRGSMLMASWFGAPAREPHDLDFIVVPQDWGIEEARTERMLTAIAEAAERVAAREGGLVVAAAGAVCEDIWTYERVPGRRLVLPWSAPGLPGGQVQLDFVFNERLPAPAEPTEVAGVRVPAATPELSLAWKLVWLATDMYPQGKDLYDAVLLAERYAAPYELVHTVFRESGEFFPPGAAEDAPVTLEAFAEARWVDWEQFAQEYPGVGGSAEAYAGRLLAALGPTFAGRD